METLFRVVCPYCGEEVEIYIEPDMRGTVVQDCEVVPQPVASSDRGRPWGALDGSPAGGRLRVAPPPLNA
jgi:hypothetical protein